MGVWRPMADLFLDELVRHDSLGDHGGPKVGCTLCPQCYTRGDAGPDAVRIFKCRQCGEFLQCKDCCIAGHAKTPLHFIEVCCVCINLVFFERLLIRRAGVEQRVLGGHFALRAGLCLPAGSWRSSMPFPRSTVAHHDSD
jgi:hypothetical protein